MLVCKPKIDKIPGKILISITFAPEQCEHEKIFIKYNLKLLFVMSKERSRFCNYFCGILLCMSLPLPSFYIDSIL